MAVSQQDNQEYISLSFKKKDLIAINSTDLYSWIYILDLQMYLV